RELAAAQRLHHVPGPALLPGARPARSRGGRRSRAGRLLRILVVERAAGPHLHGRHRLARPGRGAGGPCRVHQDPAAAGHPRRAGRAAATDHDQPVGLLAALRRPLTSYYLIIGITTLLLALGLVMVLSTSSASQLAEGASPYAGFQHQLVGVVLGVPCMWLAARTSPRAFRAAAYPLMFVAIVGLLLVPLIGVTSGG